MEKHYTVQKVSKSTYRVSADEGYLIEYDEETFVKELFTDERALTTDYVTVKEEDVE